MHVLALPASSDEYYGIGDICAIKVVPTQLCGDSGCLAASDDSNAHPLSNGHHTFVDVGGRSLRMSHSLWDTIRLTSRELGGMGGDADPVCIWLVQESTRSRVYTQRAWSANCQCSFWD